LIALILAVAGGFMGIVGALITELQTDPVGIILLIFGAPVVEEALKPSGIFLLLVRWPMALRGRLHTAALCGLSGLVFGLVESLIYVEVYNPDGGDNFVLFRFTVTPALHIIASFMVGLGLSRATHAWAVGRQPLPRATRNWFMAGAGLHAAYNTLAIVLSVLGVLDFLDE